MIEMGRVDRIKKDSNLMSNINKYPFSPLIVLEAGPNLEAVPSLEEVVDMEQQHDAVQGFQAVRSTRSHSEQPQAGGKEPDANFTLNIEIGKSGGKVSCKGEKLRDLLRIHH